MEIFCFLLLPAIISVASGLALRRFLKSSAGPPAAQRKLLRLLLGNALVLLFLAALLFLAGETYFRSSEQTDGGAVTRASRRWYKRYYHENTQHFRDNVDYQLALLPGKRRITFCGDSFTVGWGVKNVEDRFANIIRKNNPQWDIQVQALEGLSTQEELKNLLRVHAMGCQFDVLVLVYVPNDAEDLVVDDLFMETSQAPWLVRHSDFINTMYYRIKTGYDPNRQAYLKCYQSPLWEQHTNDLTTLRNFVQSTGARLMVVTFPFINAPLDQTYQFRFAHQKLAEFWRQIGVPHLDLLPIYEKFSPQQLRVNRFDAHPNEFAHQLAANAIQKFLRENVPGVVR
ncbi:MAG: hypothetical protein C5B50_26810 [Verrucomicrobia bacterium]|nr:MAG: hypothetical protein C5B50_26810 [Verrucomicrobiota bacterium]